MNPDLEIERLRWTLSDRGWEPSETDTICDMASNDINNIILDVISNATSTAITHAESIGALSFINDIDIIQEGWIYIISTKSGNMDYSVSGRKNLPNLLKNAKTAKDGSRYKVIPIKDKKIGTSSFDVAREMQRDVDAARAELMQSKDGRSARASSMIESFRKNIGKSSINLSEANSIGITTGFRTASSKQDADSQWVVPDIDRDMTTYIANLNNNIRSTIYDAVSTIIESYEEEYR